MSNQVILEKPKGKGNKTLFIGLGIGIFACIVCIVAVIGAIFIFTQPAVDTGNDFMSALRDNEFDAAFAMMSPGLQGELGSVARFSRDIRELNLEPVEWGFNSSSRENNAAELSGHVTYSDGRRWQLYLALENNDGWHITAFRFNPDE